MANPTDALLATLEAEIEERKNFQNALVTAAQEQSRDLRKEELELIERASTRMTEIETQMGPLREGARIAAESGKRTAELRQMYATARDPRASLANVEYRTAGAYIADLYYARMGDEDAIARTELYNRVAAHQTTVDNPGLLPESIVGPVVNFVDLARPLVSAIGPEDLGTGTWAYARVTQNTQVGPQSAEKTELPSRKMTVTKTPITAPTLGGYVNVSRQDIVRTSPGILDMIVADLAGQYAIETEQDAGTTLEGAAVAGPTFPLTGGTALEIATAVWSAAGMAATATKGQGRIVVAVSPDQLGVIGPLFPPVNPQNAFSASGFAPSGVGGPVGSFANIGGAIMSPGLPANTILVFSTAAARCFEYRYGNMQVVEPSVWGVQVGYAGDFETVAIEPTGIVKVTQA